MARRFEAPGPRPARFEVSGGRLAIEWKSSLGVYRLASAEPLSLEAGDLKLIAKRVRRLPALSLGATESQPERVVVLDLTLISIPAKLQPLFRKQQDELYAEHGLHLIVCHALRGATGELAVRLAQLGRAPIRLPFKSTASLDLYLSTRRSLLRRHGGEP